MASEVDTRCVLCGIDSDAAPLVRLEYRGAPLWICTQHLPVLIHDPQQLVGRLAGAEKLRPAEHKD